MATNAIVHLPVERHDDSMTLVSLDLSAAVPALFLLALLVAS